MEFYNPYEIEIKGGNPKSGWLIRRIKTCEYYEFIDVKLLFFRHIEKKMIEKMLFPLQFLFAIT